MVVSHHTRQISHDVALGEIRFSKDNVVTKSPYTGSNFWRNVGSPNLGQNPAG